MADGFVELNPERITTHDGVTELNRMLQFLYDNVAGDGETVRVYRGYGSPLNVVAAGIGSIYMRLDGGAITSIYIKESGTDGTGWVAK
jgi:hypothetical protein